MKNFTISYKFLCFLLGVGLLFSSSGRVLAQTYQLPTAGSVSYHTCSGTLYDDGGPADPYDAEATGSVTLFPSTAGSKLRLAFTLLEVDSVHTNVMVYDGVDDQAPLIGYFHHGLPTVYATGSTGALTVVLSGNTGLPLRGFAATISCVASLPAPDLAVQNLQLTPTSALAGDVVKATVRLTNLAGRAAPTRLSYFLSPDPQVSEGDLPLGTTDFIVTAGDWLDTAQPCQLPGGTAPGTYYVLCVAQATGVVETNLANNSAYAVLHVLAPTPTTDLVIPYAAYFGLRQLTAGTGFSIDTKVQNLGRLPAQASTVGYYFSADTTLSPDDDLVGDAPVEALAAGGITFVRGTVGIPAGTAAGTYYVLCVADYLDQAAEDDERNNSFALKLVVVPPRVDVDFTNRRAIYPNQPAAGGRVTVVSYLHNAGSEPLDSATVGYYFSTDRRLSADDVLLDHATVGALTPDDSFNGLLERSITIPRATPLGNYYLLLVADYRNQLTESDEQNNVAALPLQVVIPNVDLVINSPGAFGPVVGNPLLTNCTLANRGTTAAYPGTVGYYLSTDQLLSADDLLLGSTAGLPVAGGGTQPAEGRFIIPAGTAPGNYYVLYVADYLKQLSEINENNNISALAIKVIPPDVDLSLNYNFNVLPESAPAGTDIKTACYLANGGTTTAYAPAVGFYLSTDNVLSANDVLIGSTDFYAVSADSYVYQTGTATIPLATAPGKYYVLGVADYLNQLAETDETNNLRFTTLEVLPAYPDLTISTTPYVSPTRAVAGAKVSLLNYVHNVGYGIAKPSRVGYYLSTDNELSANDVLLGSAPSEEVYPGYAAYVTSTATIPAATPAGQYYVLFVADYLHELPDISQTNNSNYAALQITAQPLATRAQTAGYELRVAPNPVGRAAPLRVQLSGPGAQGTATLALYNSLGQRVAARPLVLLPGRLNQAEFDTRDLPAGVYLLRLTGPDLSATRRLVVE